MKAILVRKFGGPEVLKMETVPMPQGHSRDDVLIRVKAVSVNNFETQICQGNLGIHTLPYIPGNDFAGIIEEIGTGVKSFKKGDRVMGSSRNNPPTGTFCEYTAAKAENLIPLPKRMSFQQGACVVVSYGAAYRALIQKAKAKAGELVLIHGATGGVGIPAVQLARTYGMIVIGTAGSSEGMKIAKEAGAHFVFNHKKADYISQIEKVSKGDGIDVVIELNASENLAKDLQIVGANSRIVVVGGFGTVEIRPSDTLLNETSIVGMSLIRAESDVECMNAVRAGVETGWVQPVVWKVLALNDTAKAHEELLKNKGCRGKIVLTVD